MKGIMGHLLKIYLELKKEPVFKDMVFYWDDGMGLYFPELKANDLGFEVIIISDNDFYNKNHVMAGFYTKEQWDDGDYPLRESEYLISFDLVKDIELIKSIVAAYI